MSAEGTVENGVVGNGIKVIEHERRMGWVNVITKYLSWLWKCRTIENSVNTWK